MKFAIVFLEVLLPLGVIMASIVDPSIAKKHLNNENLRKTVQVLLFAFAWVQFMDFVGNQFGYDSMRLLPVRTGDWSYWLHVFVVVSCLVSYFFLSDTPQQNGAVDFGEPRPRGATQRTQPQNRATTAETDVTQRVIRSKRNYNVSGWLRWIIVAFLALLTAFATSLILYGIFHEPSFKKARPALELKMSASTEALLKEMVIKYWPDGIGKRAQHKRPFEVSSMIIEQIDVAAKKNGVSADIGARSAWGTVDQELRKGQTKPLNMYFAACWVWNFFGHLKLNYLYPDALRLTASLGQPNVKKIVDNAQSDFDKLRKALLSDLNKSNKKPVKLCYS